MGGAQWDSWQRVFITLGKHLFFFADLGDSGPSTLARVLNWGILTQTALIPPDVCLARVSPNGNVFRLQQ